MDFGFFARGRRVTILVVHTLLGLHALATRFATRCPWLQGPKSKADLGDFKRLGSRCTQWWRRMSESCDLPRRLATWHHAERQALCSNTGSSFIWLFRHIRVALSVGDNIIFPSRMPQCPDKGRGGVVSEGHTSTGSYMDPWRWDDLSHRGCRLIPAPLRRSLQPRTRLVTYNSNACVLKISESFFGNFRNIYEWLDILVRT